MRLYARHVYILGKGGLLSSGEERDIAPGLK